MNKSDDLGKAGVVVGSAGLIAAAVALLSGRKAQAATGQELVLDEATANLLVAIANSIADGEAKLAAMLEALKGVKIDVGTLAVQGWPPNTKYITSHRIFIQAVNMRYEMPEIVIPDGMRILIKGWPLNGGIIYVGENRAAATNVNQVWPLLANEFVGYAIENAKEIWISGTLAGDSAVCTVEVSRRGGG